MDAALPGPSKVLDLLSLLGIALHTHAIAICNSLHSYIVQTSTNASSLKFFKYHISNTPIYILFPCSLKYTCVNSLIGALYSSIIAIVHSLLLL